MEQSCTRFPHSLPSCLPEASAVSTEQEKMEAFHLLLPVQGAGWIPSSWLRAAQSLGMFLFWIKAALMKGWSHPALGSLSIPQAVPGKGTQHSHSSCTTLLVVIRSEGKPRIVECQNSPRGGNSLAHPWHIPDSEVTWCLPTAAFAMVRPNRLLANP